MVLEYYVENNDINKNVNQILSEKFELSNRLFSKLIKNKRIYINGESIDTRVKPYLYDKIIVDLNYNEDNSNIISKKIDLDIIYEDDGMLIINKPAGFAVHPSMRHFDNSIANGVKYYFETKGINKKIRPVNRLDIDTSGLIIFAKNEYIQENLIKQMKTRNFTKEYIAAALGIFEKKKGKIDVPIARKEGSIIERCVREDGQKAVTEYEVIREIGNSSLIKCKLLTGRTHQIRVHMSYIGHPLLGDSLYGEKSNFIDGQALHCYKLKFLHPISREKVEIMSNSNIEQKFEKLLENLLTN